MTQENDIDKLEEGWKKLLAPYAGLTFTINKDLAGNGIWKIRFSRKLSELLMQARKKNPLIVKFSIGKFSVSIKNRTITADYLGITSSVNALIRVLATELEEKQQEVKADKQKIVLETREYLLRLLTDKLSGWNIKKKQARISSVYYDNAANLYYAQIKIKDDGVLFQEPIGGYAKSPDLDKNFIRILRVTLGEYGIKVPKDAEQ